VNNTASFLAGASSKPVCQRWGCPSQLLSEEIALLWEGSPSTTSWLSWQPLYTSYDGSIPGYSVDIFGENITSSISCKYYFAVIYSQMPTYLRGYFASLRFHRITQPTHIVAGGMRPHFIAISRSVIQNHSEPLFLVASAHRFPVQNGFPPRTSNCGNPTTDGSFGNSGNHFRSCDSRCTRYDIQSSNLRIRMDLFLHSGGYDGSIIWSLYVV